MKPAFYQIRTQYRNDTTDYLEFRFQLDDVGNTPIDLTKLNKEKKDTNGK